MYKLHLILKYLRKRRIAWVSLAAVTLCTAMVLIVISVMGGWLQTFLQTSQDLEGDIIVSTRDDTGFAHYQEIMDEVRKLPGVGGATAAIVTYGLANFGDQLRCKVSVRAYSDLEQVSSVNSFYKGLYRQYQQPIAAIEQDASLSAAEKEKRKAALLANGPTFDTFLSPEEYRNYSPNSKIDASKFAGIIPGTPLILRKGTDGKYERGPGIYTYWVNLTVGDLRSADKMSPTVITSPYWIVDDCRTNVYPVDREIVYVPFKKLQQEAGMAEDSYKEKVGDQLVDRVDPARVSEIQIGAREPVRSDAKALAALCAQVQTIVDATSQKYATGVDLTAQTWDKQQATYTSAIRHEEILLIFLFGIVSLVAVFLVFCIFYMIVAEKTRDIGIIKSVGASNWGVAQIFLGYGLSIGLLGGGTGLLLAWLVVHNINALHAWIGRVFGIVIWDPQTYIFDTIPSSMQAHDVIWIVSVAVLSALAGAMAPALRAAAMNPVEALRWE